WTLLGSGPDGEAATLRAAGLFAAALRGDPNFPEARLGLLTARRNRGFDLLWSNRPGPASVVIRASLRDLRSERFNGQLQRDARSCSTAFAGTARRPPCRGLASPSELLSWRNRPATRKVGAPLASRGRTTPGYSLRLDSAKRPAGPLALPGKRGKRFATPAT